MTSVNILFKNNGLAVRDGLPLGVLAGEEESSVYDLEIFHSSNFPIRDCGIYIDSVGEFYNGGNTAQFDYATLLWMADNYTGYGLSINQKYEVFGEIYKQDSSRLVDLGRVEKNDIFIGEYVEVLSGPSAGEKIKITGYNFENSMLLLERDFTTDVTDLSYKISIDKTHFFKTQQGSSVDYAIPLLYNSGIIPRFESAIVSLQLRMPPFFKKSALAAVDFNLRFTPEE